MRVVIVTMDTHLASATERAARILRREMPGLSLVLHAATEFGDSPEKLAACRRDIAAGDIVICAMLFMEDHFRAILADLQARRDGCDTLVCMLSAAEVTTLTRIGAFRMDNPSKGGAMALLKRLKGSDKPRTASTGAHQMRMLKRLPKILRFIPGTAQDVRAYFLALQYWLAGSDENVVNMVRMLWTATPTARAGPCAAASGPPPRCCTRRSESTIRACPAGCRRTRRRFPPEARAGPSACCACAPTCSPATAPITTASSRRSRRGACG